MKILENWEFQDWHAIFANLKLSTLMLAHNCTNVELLDLQVNIANLSSIFCYLISDNFEFYCGQ